MKSLDLYSNGEKANETVLNRPLQQIETHLAVLSFDIIVGTALEVSGGIATHVITDWVAAVVDNSKIIFLDGAHVPTENIVLTEAGLIITMQSNAATIDTDTYSIDISGDYCDVRLNTTTLGNVTFAGTGSNLNENGNITTNGTVTTIDTDTIKVEDNNIELGSVDTPSDATADGGGITIKGASDKTLYWDQTTGRWIFGQGLSVPNNLVMTGTGTDAYFQPPKLTTIQKDALVSPQDGWVVFDTDLKSLQQYSESAWGSIGGGFKVTKITQGTAYTCDGKEGVLICTPTADHTVELPDASANEDTTLTIKNVDGTYYITVIDESAGTDLIEGETSWDLGQYDYITVICDGSTWHKIGGNTFHDKTTANEYTTYPNSGAWTLEQVNS